MSATDHPADAARIAREARSRLRLRVLGVFSLLAACGVATTGLLAGEAANWPGLVACALLISAAGVLALDRMLLRPLGEIGRFAHQAARGELDQRIPISEESAVGEISSALGRMAEELRQRIDEATSGKERLQAVLGAMVEGVLVVSAERRVVLANPRLREMFGIWSAFEGRPLLEVIRNAEVDDALREAMVSTEPVVGEIEIGGEEPHQVLIHAVRFRATGARPGVVAVFHDVTELRRLENVRRDFVANVSHELKTPLTAIRGFAETLASGEVPPEEMKSFSAVILKHAERLGNLIEDVLELSRIESRKGRLQPSPVDLCRVAETVASLMRSALEGRSLALELELEAGPEAWADRRATEQILTNLLDNAAKYTDAGGRVTLRVGHDASDVILQVSDTGIGIPEEARSRIFERFYRVDRARSRDLGGTGLGLAIVKHLVQAMGGRIYVESQLGRGSTFSVRLPRADRRPPSDVPRS
jgi:two-component system phosphate regulon sensor histidine kinase PhoR